MQVQASTSSRWASSTPTPAWTSLSVRAHTLRAVRKSQQASAHLLIKRTYSSWQAARLTLDMPCRAQRSQQGGPVSAQQAEQRPPAGSPAHCRCRACQQLQSLYQRQQQQPGADPEQAVSCGPVACTLSERAGVGERGRVLHHCLLCSLTRLSQRVPVPAVLTEESQFLPSYQGKA